MFALQKGLHSICMFVCLRKRSTLKTSICLPPSLSTHLSVNILSCLSVYLPSCLSARMPVCLLTCLSMCLSVRLLASFSLPISRSHSLFLFIQAGISALANPGANTHGQNEQSNVGRTCQVCNVMPMDAVLLNCNHAGTCWICARRLTICPICGQRVLGFIYIYLNNSGDV